MQPIALNLVNIKKIVISVKFKHSDKGFQYLVGYADDDIIRPLHIVLPQMSGYIKYFDKDRKNMPIKMEEIYIGKIYWYLERNERDARHEPS